MSICSSLHPPAPAVSQSSPSLTSAFMLLSPGLLFRRNGKMRGCALDDAIVVVLLLVLLLFWRLWCCRGGGEMEGFKGGWDG